MGHNKELLCFGDLDLIFKVRAIEKRNSMGDFLFSLKILLIDENVNEEIVMYKFRSFFPNKSFDFFSFSP